MTVFNTSEPTSEPVFLDADDNATKYLRDDGTEFWAFSSLEVFYEDERMFVALNRIKELEDLVHNMQVVAMRAGVDVGIDFVNKVIELTEIDKQVFRDGGWIEK